MLMPDAYSADPEAFTAFQWRCAVCGDNRQHVEKARPGPRDGTPYPGRHHLMVAWGWDAEGRRHTLPLAVHAGRCWDALDDIEAQRDDLVWLSVNATDVNRYATNNLATPTTPGRRGVLELNEWPVDLLWTHEILAAIDSPLIRQTVKR